MRVKKYAMASGKVIDLDDFHANSFTLDDIAHHLAKIQRYNGSLPIDVTYSVAEHSINIYKYIESTYIEEEERIYNYLISLKVSLLHDMSEAFLCDLPSYLKPYIPQYKELEAKVQEVVYIKYLGGTIDDSFLDPYDKGIVRDEIKAINPKNLHIYEDYNKNEPIGCKIWYNNKPSVVKAEFLRLCAEVGISDDETI